MPTSEHEGEQPFRIYTPASFGQAIRHYRTQAGLTQDELAERVGIDRTYLSRLEGGGETRQLRRILAILRELGIKASLERADW
ncbi:MAG TPA: helix-turn-helix domain-containing protein [Solirubrobacteraceae bacterium]|nr:helix-turn-helix domain-containing protein [Solirubrobacteraceae bacterium]